jgi:hypothetical protein
MKMDKDINKPIKDIKFNIEKIKERVESKTYKDFKS